MEIGILRNALAMYGCMEYALCSWISKISEFWIECVYAIAYFADGGDMSNI